MIQLTHNKGKRKCKGPKFGFSGIIIVLFLCVCRSDRQTDTLDRRLRQIDTSDRQTPQTDRHIRQTDASDRQTPQTDRRLRQTDTSDRQTHQTDRHLTGAYCVYTQ